MVKYILLHWFSFSELFWLLSNIYSSILTLRLHYNFFPQFLVILIEIIVHLKINLRRLYILGISSPYPITWCICVFQKFRSCHQLLTFPHLLHPLPLQVLLPKLIPNLSTWLHIHSNLAQIIILSSWSTTTACSLGSLFLLFTPKRPFPSINHVKS